MTKIKQTLQTLIATYEAVRQVGHTTAMLEGAKNVKDVVILTVHHQQSEDLKRSAPHATFVPVRNIERIRGVTKPIVIDNYAAVILLSDAYDEICRLEGEKLKLENKISGALRELGASLTDRA